MKLKDSIIPKSTIESQILVIRGHKVILGSDLANLYGIETRVLMQAVKRNRERFPMDFMFALTRGEIRSISQIVISLKYSKAVYAFTEQGVAMLSGLVNSPRAIQMNIAIMRAFVKIRKVLSGNKELELKMRQLEMRVGEHDKEIQAIFEAIRQLMAPPVQEPKQPIGF